jgi:hypothetical protein
MEHRRRTAQHSAALKLKAKWRPPTIMNTTNDDAKTEVTKKEEENTGMFHVNDAPPQAMEVPRIETPAIQEDNVKGRDIPSQRKNVAASVLSRSENIKQEKVTYVHNHTLSKVHQQSPQNVASCETEVIEETSSNVNQSNKRLQLQDTENRAITLPSLVNQALKTDGNASEKSKSVMFRSPMIHINNTAHQMDSSGHESIAAVEEGFVGLKVQETLETDSALYDDFPAEDAFTGMQIDEEEDFKIKNTSNSPQNTKEKDVRIETTLTAIQITKDDSSGISSDPIPALNHVPDPANTMNIDVQIGNYEKELRAGSKRPTLDNAAEKVVCTTYICFSLDVSSVLM